MTADLPRTDAGKRTVTAGTDGTTAALTVTALLLLFTFAAPSLLDIFVHIRPLTVYFLISVASVAIHLAAFNERNWIRIDTIFLLGYMIVYYQWIAMMEVSGITPADFFNSTANSQYIVFGAWLSTVGLLSWLVGYNFFRPAQRQSLQTVQGVGTVQLAFLALLALFVAVVGPDYLTGEIYRNVRQGGFVTLSGYASYIYTALPLLILLIVATQMYPRVNSGDVGPWELRISVALVALFCLIFAASGERGAVVQVLGGGAILYCSARRPVGPLGFLALAFIGALAFSLIGIFRAGLSVPWEDLYGEGLYSATLNLANSARALFLGLEIVDRQGGLFWGQLWLANILSVLPFAQSTFIDLTGLSQWDIDSAYLIAFYRYGPNPHTGDGSTLIGDVYMNFGTVGVVIFPFLFGCICRQMQRFASGSDGFMPFVVAGVFASLIFYISRGTFLFQLRPIVWSIVLAYVLLRVRATK
jgi:oligosaccharide repeat unit polymerase